MDKRKLGNTDLLVSPVTFGGNVFGWTLDEKKSFEVLDGFIEAGFNFIDTADVYSRWVPENKGGESETIIGNWMKARNNRNQIILATKVGSNMELNGKKCLSKKYILEAVDASLLRLKTDYIDLYQSHYDDPETPVQETLEAYDQLIRTGKVRWIGASNFSAERFKESLETSARLSLPKYQTFQPEYNLYKREGFEKELEQICLDNQVGVINYYSLASGFLTGKYRSETDLGKSQRGSAVKEFMNPRGFRILKALDEVSEQYNSSLASVALAWLMARPSVTSPIASVTSLAQLKNLTKAAALRLDVEVISILDAASAWE
ncbi:aryl-alcohol dehydrogenase-like predicted oxidoreductase [Pedobacter cryoconitis]|uniref:Aryl-alcohol dehydrogenase-like predicted oxidoreductase n=1 Tax=Pedobacter cryoconitis TaxID=188932 RepID=A0A7W8YT60_9SPHI|nr:aldo/keto reductase [Pedobacter cryoconitis]MBB5621304.1 aryl-alcohol dehydrogenase-like predicted oxidoreductase [Pedobacter cryoconitis]